MGHFWPIYFLNMSATPNIDILIPTLNEELNLPQALNSVKGWARKVFVVDSGSTDRTCQIARDAGAVVIEKEWLGYARQKNWALDNLPFESDWVFILDADEVILPKLRDELLAIAARSPAEVNEAGFYVNRYLIFLGKRIRHCGYYPSWNLRFFKRGRARYEERAVHEHMLVTGPAGYLKGHMEHYDHRGLDLYVAKHNRYSTLEASEIVRHRREGEKGLFKARFFGNVLERRRWMKHRFYGRMPMMWLWRFIYMYFFRLGILDGRTGYHFCLFISSYEHLIQLKMIEIQRGLQRMAAPAGGPTIVPSQVPVEGSADTASDDAVARPQSELSDWEINRAPESAAAASPMEITARHVSPWSTRDKVFRLLWAIVESTVFRYSFRTMYSWRAFLLRLFGARIGKKCIVRRTVRVEVPWNLTMGDHSCIGDECIVYSLGPITLGDRVTISQYTYLCAGTHDHTRPDFPLLRPPIDISDDVWIAADVFVGPAVHIGRGALIGARSSVFKDLPPWQVCVGNPARPIKNRVYHGPRI